MKKWLDEFKLALMQEDIQSLDELLETIDYTKVDLEQIKILLQQAITLVSEKKDIKAKEIQKFRKAMEYVKA